MWPVNRRVAFPFAAFTAFALALAPASAEACGGFVFDAIDTDAAMAGQQIFVGFGEDATHLVVSATVSQATANAAFILPLAQPPTQVLDGELELFDALHRGTAPRFQISDGEDDSGVVGCGFRDDVKAGGDGNAFEDGDVVIYDSGATASYEYVVVGGDTGQSIAQWLDQEGFVLNAETEAVMQPYVDQNWVFLAAKLSPSASVESLAPLQLALPAAPPETFSIPFSFGAPSLPSGAPVELVLYVLAGGTTTPANYAVDEVDPSELRAVSLSSSNYRELFDEALNEHPEGVFITEFVSGDWTPSHLTGWYEEWWYGGGDTGGGTGGDTQTWLNDVWLNGTLTRMRTRLHADQLEDLRFSFGAARELSYQQSLTYEEEGRGCRVGDRSGGAGLALLGLLALWPIRRRPRP